MATRIAQRGPTRPAGLLTLAAACGLAAATLAYRQISRQAPPRTTSPAPTVGVVVAASDIPARTLVTSPLIQWRRVAAAQAPADAVRRPAEAVGKVTTVALPAGEPIPADALAVRSAALGLAYAIPLSRRAATIPLDPVSGMAGLLRPGDHVDVLATTDGGGQSVTRTALQNVTLLALGAQTGTAPAPEPADAKAPQSATLLVSPRDAQTLALAAARGRLQLILRPPDDDARPDLPPLRVSTAAMPAAKPPPAPPPGATKPVAPKAAGGTTPPASPPADGVTIIEGTQIKTVSVRP